VSLLDEAAPDEAGHLELVLHNQDTHLDRIVPDVDESKMRRGGAALIVVSDRRRTVTRTRSKGAR